MTAAARAPLLLKFSRKVSSVHRWLGVLLCAFFVLWFATGFVMIYVPFPSLGDAARIAASPPIDAAALRTTPADALATLATQGHADVESLRLVQPDAEPRYVVAFRDGPLRAVSARSGAELPALDERAAQSIAERFGGRPVATIDGPFAYDQWVVHQRFDSARPFFRADLADAAGTALYVSARTGEVLQRTTRFERGWNWVGAVVHWLYPTVLRKSFAAWDQTVWWLSLVGIATVLAGLWLGVVRTANLRRKRGAGVSPFIGWMRWHHVLGLSGGVLVLTWIFSGWLSMDHGRLFSLEVPDAGLPARLRGMPIAKAVAPVSLAQIADWMPAHEIEFTALGLQPFVVVRQGGATPSTVRAIDAPGARAAIVRTPAPLLPDSLLRSAVQAAYPSVPVTSIAPIADDDAYGHLRSGALPPGTRRVTLGDAGETWVHIDAASGRLIGVMDRSRRLLRWLFEGLHTFDIPLLNRAGPLWQVLMLAALAVGLAFSLTALMLGTRRVRRSL